MPATEILRPESWNGYIGQHNLKERLRLAIDSAKLRSAPLDHILMLGPPGYGKTSLAEIIAREFGAEYDRLVMPFKSAKSMEVMLYVKEGVLVLDELHKLRPADQEKLLPVLEEGVVYCSYGQVSTQGLTIIGATTNPEKLLDSLIDRFPIKATLEEYSDSEMGQIISGMAARLDLELAEETIATLSRAAAGIPRQARNLLLCSRDLALTGRENDVESILKFSGLTEYGLDENQVEYLGVLENIGSAGLDVLSSRLRVSKTMIMNYERGMIRQGLIEFTGKGRSLTGSGMKMLLRIDRGKANK